jgi:hypothetical protein
MAEHIAAVNPTSTMIDKIQPLPTIITTVTGLHAVRKPMHIS